MTGSSLTPRSATDLGPHEQFEFDIRLAKALSASAVFKGDRGEALPWEQSLVKILIGRDLGMNPTQAMMGIDLIEGKPSVSGATLAARVNQLPGKRYQIVRHTNDACEIHWYERAGLDSASGAKVVHARWRHATDCPVAADKENDRARTEDGCDCNPSEQSSDERYLGLSRFDEADRERAEIRLKTSKGYPTNHAKYPRAMKFNRAISAGQKMYAAEATLGIPVYTEGEIEPQRFDAGTGDLEEPRSLHAIVQELVPWHLRERFHAAWSEAVRTRKGMLTRAAVEMALDGRTPEEVEAYIAQVEADNTAADERAQPVDATVEDLDGSGDILAGDGGKLPASAEEERPVAPVQEQPR